MYIYIPPVTVVTDTNTNIFPERVVDVNISPVTVGIDTINNQLCAESNDEKENPTRKLFSICLNLFPEKLIDVYSVSLLVQLTLIQATLNEEN